MKIFAYYTGRLTPHDSPGEPNEAAMRIANVKPNFIVAVVYGGYYNAWQYEPLNLTPQVLELFHSKGIKVLGYIAGTHHGLPYTYGGVDYPARNFETETKIEIQKVMETGADGVFDGEVYHMTHDWPVEIIDYNIAKPFFQKYYAEVKSYGSDKIVAFNTGTWYTDEEIMAMCDILSLEHLWLKFTEERPWHKTYSPDRFYGTNDDRGELPEQTLEEAIELTKLAHSVGIGLHYSTPTHGTLASWFEQYIEAITPKPPILATLGGIIIGGGIGYVLNRKKPVVPIIVGAVTGGTIGFIIDRTLRS